MYITLTKALAENRLDEFIQQMEQLNIGSIEESDFNRTLSSLLIQKQSEDQTLHSSGDDGLI